MKQQRRHVTMVVALGCALSFVPERASACSGNACTGVQLAPSAGTVPANLAGFFTQFGSYDSAETKTLELVRTDVAGTVVVGPDFKLKSKLVVGGSYRATLKLSATKNCPAKDVVASFVAGPEVALPTTLGDPVVVKQGHENTPVGFTNASCYSSIPSAYVDLEPSLPGDTAAWRGSVVGVRAVVDGKDYWLSSEQQPADAFYPTAGSGVQLTTGGDLQVRVFVACAPIKPGEASSYVPLTEGRHTVKLVATVAGLGELSSTDTTIELRCPPGAPNRDAAVPQVDGSAHDGGLGVNEPPVRTDASVTPAAPRGGDASMRDVDASNAVGVDDNEDTGCHAGPRSHGGASGLLIALLVWLRSRARAAKSWA